jgi:hypothetical protein
MLHSADALTRKSPDGTQGLSVANRSATNPVNHASEKSKMKSPAEEYHRAAGVNRGECTKQLKPELFFIGHAYSGSTTLSKQMGLHPELSDGDTKEHQFFRKEFKLIQSDNKYNDYLEEFWVSCNSTVAYDASMSYFAIGESPEALRYMKGRVGPNVKLILMIRDPIDIVFHYMCHEPANVAPALADLAPFSQDAPTNLSAKPAILGAEWLSQWLKVFPKRKNWLFIDSDVYFASPEKVLRQVFSFSGVSDMQLNESDLKKSTSGRRRCTLKPSDEDREIFWSVEDNKKEKKRMERLTGLKFGWAS